MNRREGFEAYWAAQHGIPVESLAQYRCDDERQYTLPKMASRYRVWCAALDCKEAMDLDAVARGIRDLKVVQ